MPKAPFDDLYAEMRDPETIARHVRDFLEGPEGPGGDHLDPDAEVNWRRLLELSA